MINIVLTDGNIIVMLRRIPVRNIRRSYSTREFAYDTRLTSRIDSGRIASVLEAAPRYPRCASAKQLIQVKDEPEKWAKIILKSKPAVLDICLNSAATLSIKGDNGVYTITHTPHPGVVREKSPFEEHSARNDIPRSSTIRSLDSLRNMNFHYNDATVDAIAAVWKKVHWEYSLYRHPDFSKVYSQYENRQWHTIVGDWITQSNPALTALEELRPELERYVQEHKHYPIVDFTLILGVINDLIRYGDDGYVILNPYLRNYSGCYGMWNSTQDRINDYVQMARDEHRLTDQHQAGKSIDDLIKQVPEGSLEGIPYPPSVVPYFDRLYSLIKTSPVWQRWLLGTPDNLSRHPIFWPKDVVDHMGDLKDHESLLIAARSVHDILEHGWYKFVCNHIVKHCFGTRY